MPTQPSTTASNALDPQIVNLAKSIRGAETSPEGDFTKTGASGEYGAYQWRPDTWAKQSAAAGVNVALKDATPEQQNEVAYKTLASWKTAHPNWNIGNFASAWNAGEGAPEAYLGNSGTNAEGVKYDTKAYAEKVAANYQQIKTGDSSGAQSQNIAPPVPAGQSQSSGATGAYAPPTPPSNGEANVAQASTNNSAPESTVQKAGDVLGSVGNFLFPAAKDFYNDVTGKNTGADKKTFLQQAGDTALSVLPFIPGLGEAGEAARGAEIAGEGAAKVAPGILSKLAGSTVAKNAAVGYGAGVASNLSQGQSIGQSLTPGLNTIGGAVLGAGGALAGKAIGGVLDAATGIPKNRVPLLSSLSDPNLYEEYAKVGTARAADERAPSLLQNGIGHAENAVGQIQQKLDEVGPQVEQTKNAEGSKPINPVTPVLQNFAKNVERYFGKTISVGEDGSINLENAPGRMKETLSNADQGRIKTALAQILSLNKGGTVRQASDVIDNLRNLVDYSNKDLLGNSNDPAEGFLKATAHDLNETVAKSSPALAAVKSRFAGLSDTLDTIKAGGGSNFQRAGLLLKRALSPDQGDVSQNIFKIIKGETGIDLQEHAGLIKHFTDAMGDKSEKSALSNLLEESASKGAPTIPSLLLTGGKAALNATIANPIKQGRRIVQGKPGILGPILRNSKGVLTKGLLTAGRAVLGQ